MAVSGGGEVELTDRAAVRVIRSRIRLWVAGVIAWLTGIFGLAQLGYTAVAEPSTWQGGLVAFAIPTIIAAALGVMLVRPRLVVSNTGVHVVNPVRTTFVSWRDIENLAVGDTRVGPSLQILTRDGRWVSAVAVQPARIRPLSGRQPFVERVAQELDTLAERYRLADSQPDPRAARAGEGPLLVSAAVYAICVVGILVAGLATS
ncbi:MAG: PH domain-containing protein [Actinomycetes bacterium]